MRAPARGAGVRKLGSAPPLSPSTPQFCSTLNSPLRERAGSDPEGTHEGTSRPSRFPRSRADKHLDLTGVMTLQEWTAHEPPLAKKVFPSERFRERLVNARS